jgi:hypothetical protein
VSTLANRIIEITSEGVIDVMMDFDEYLAMKEESMSEDKGVSEEDIDYIDRKAA